MTVAPAPNGRLTGSCLCGAVTYQVEGPVRDVFDCHCERCRRFTGHHMAATAAQPSQVTFTGAEPTWFSPHETVEYGFCGRCGSSMFWRATNGRSHISIAAGTLDQPTGLRTTAAWWVVEAADYHERASGLVEHEGDG